MTYLTQSPGLTDQERDQVLARAVDVIAKIPGAMQRLDDAQAQTNALVNQLVTSVDSLVDEVIRLTAATQRAVDQVQASSRTGLRKVPRPDH